MCLIRIHKRDSDGLTREAADVDIGSHTIPSSEHCFKRMQHTCRVIVYTLNIDWITAGGLPLHGLTEARLDTEWAMSQRTGAQIRMKGGHKNLNIKKPIGIIFKQRVYFSVVCAMKDQVGGCLLSSWFNMILREWKEGKQYNRCSELRPRDADFSVLVIVTW